MNSKIKQITEKAINEINELYEYRAFTALAYFILDEDFQKGRTLNIELTNVYEKRVNQQYLQKKYSEYKNKYLLETTFQHTVSIIESWFFDLLHEILKDQNRINKKKQITVSQILECGNYKNVIEYIINSEINDLKYKKVSEWFDYLNKFYSFTSVNNDLIKQFAEIKATRDLLVHNNLIVNSIYLEKAQDKARAEVGETIPLTPEYVKDTWAIMKKIVCDLGDEIYKNLI